MFSMDARLKIVNYNVKSEKISNEIKLALITDLHCCLYGENQSGLLSEIEEVNPDAVLLGGDIFDDVYVNDNSNILVESLVDKYKVFYVSGNHEWWGNEMYKIFDYLENVGVTVLRGDKEVLEINGNKIAICGVDDPAMSRYDDTYPGFGEQLKTLGDSIDEDCFNVLLTHRPEQVKQYLEYDFDLILSGHAHGGQFRIPFVLNGFLAPDQGFFPEYAGGNYDLEKTTMIVSRGLSRENMNIPRIFNRPELVFVSIK